MALSAVLFIIVLLAIHLKELLKTRTTESGDDYITGKGDIDVQKNSQTKNNISDSIDPDECTKIISDNEERIERKLSNNDNVRGWQCACEGGNGLIFLPQSLMKSFSGPGAAMRLGAGGCYHKQM
jgi:hypothetical protein